MDHQKAEAIAEQLKGLACIDCTKDWLERHEGLTDPAQDIKDCGALRLITPKLQKRLISEIEILKK